jgi:hypothetical protein
VIIPGKFRDRWQCLPFACFVEQLIHYFLSIPEIGAFDPVKGVRKIKKAGFCGDTEKSQVPVTSIPLRRAALTPSRSSIDSTPGSG